MLPPGPKGTFIGGHFTEMSRDWLAAYTAYARQFGDVVAYRIGSFKYALVSEPALIEQVLVANADRLKKPAIQRLIHPLLGDGLLLNEGEPWKRQRRLLSPMFHRQRVAQYGDLIARLAASLCAEFNDDEVRDIHKDMTRLTLRVVALAMFGTDIGTTVQEVERVLSRAMEALSARLDTPLPLPNWIPTRGVRRLREARRRLDMLIARFIDERRRSGEVAKPDLLSVLLSVRDAETGQGLSDVQVHDEAATIFVAGFETTAITLSWAFWLLANHPHANARLASELKEVLGGRAPTSDDLPRLRFADCVIRETMRLYPPAWLIAREVTRDLEVGAYRIPKGWTVEVSPWVTHRDPRFWQEPDAFIPERWENGLHERLPRFAYFPFGGGPRVCIGNAFAMLEAILVLSVVGQECCFEPINATPRPEAGFTLRPSPGIPLRVRRANVRPLVAQAIGAPSGSV
jgi:cytochrome P450